VFEDEMPTAPTGFVNASLWQLVMMLEQPTITGVPGINIQNVYPADCACGDCD
jgi:hypothetical protein